MLTIEVGPAVSDGATATQPNPHHQAGHLDYIARSARIAALAWRYKDAARAQAQKGIIAWAQYRAYCAQVDRITRARLRAAMEAERIPNGAEVRRSGELAATAALMKSRHTGNERDTHLDKRAKSPRAQRQAMVVEALRAEPQLSDREHARRLGVSDKTVGSARRRLEQSAEIPHFLRRVDPRSGRMSQPSTRCAQRTSATVELAGVV